MRRFLVALATLMLIVGASSGLLMFLPVLPHSQRDSPDGEFRAVSRTQPFYVLVAFMPGQGSDKPGTVTVYRDNQSCGSAWVPMVSFLYDLQWQLERRPRQAEIRAVVTWNLDDCSMQI